jgi:hypothetical protein
MGTYSLPVDDVDEFAVRRLHCNTVTLDSHVPSTAAT